jgi:hypothetical protein
LGGDGRVVELSTVGGSVTGLRESGWFGNGVGSPEVGARDDGANVGELVVGSISVGSLETGGFEKGATVVGTRDPANIGSLAGEYDDGYALMDGTKENGARVTVDDGRAVGVLVFG